MGINVETISAYESREGDSELPRELHGADCRGGVRNYKWHMAPDGFRDNRHANPSAGQDNSSVRVDDLVKNFPTYDFVDAIVTPDIVGYVDNFVSIAQCGGMYAARCFEKLRRPG